MMLKIGDAVDPVDIDIIGQREVPIPQRWYLLRVHPHKEGKVMRAFDLRSISAYYPTVQRQRRFGHGVMRSATEPFFPGLIFVPDFELGRWRLRDIDGVIGLFQMDQCTPYLTPDLLADVRKLVAAGNLPVGKLNRLFKLGQMVRIVDGPFTGWEGRIERLDSKGRIKVLLAALKRGQSVQLTESQIEPAPAATAAGKMVRQ